MLATARMKSIMKNWDDSLEEQAEFRRSFPNAFEFFMFDKKPF